MSAHVIVLDSVNEDIFVCGLCKSVFNALELFLEHKQICVPQNIQCILTNQIVFSNEPPIVIANPDPSLFSVPQVDTTDYQQTDLQQVDTTAYQQTELPQVDTSDYQQTDIPRVDTTDYQQNDLLQVDTTDYQQTNLPPETEKVENVEHPCTVCGKTFKRKRGLLAHTRSHYEKPHQCLVCGRCFTQNSHLQRHILTHKVWPESLSDTTPKCPEDDLLCYSCQYCPLIFSNYNQFRSHLTKHQSVKKFKCIQGDCQEFYDTLEMLLNHVSCSHITQLYFCHFCFTPFDSLQGIAEHELSHNEQEEIDKQSRQYKCPQCDAVFTRPEKLSLHMFSENHKKACIHCNKTFASDKRLRLHLQIHRNLKPFKCGICGKGFHMKKYLASHMLKHGTKEFKCPICLCNFNRSDILRRHMKTHSTSKLPCPYRDILNCKREFTRKDKLKLHVRTHKPTQDNLNNVV